MVAYIILCWPVAHLPCHVKGSSALMSSMLHLYSIAKMTFAVLWSFKRGSNHLALSCIDQLFLFSSRVKVETIFLQIDFLQLFPFSQAGRGLQASLTN